MTVDLKWFELEEFACPCCGESKMDEDFLRLLDDARELAGVPFKITSGYRCKEHNKKVGGKANSAHTKGLAVDISTTTSNARYEILDSLFLHKFNRLGIGVDFIHADTDESLPQEVVWLY